MFQKNIRTTSALESYNGVLGRKIQKKGNFFKFVDMINRDEFIKSRELALMIESGGSTCEGKKRKYKYKNDKISECMQQFSKKN